MADKQSAGPTSKTVGPVSKTAGLASKTVNKGKSSVRDVTKDVESLKKVLKELKSNVELKQQLAQQEEWFTNQLSQQGTELDKKFSQIMEVLTKCDE